jgi:hypothetical protein
MTPSGSPGTSAHPLPPLRLPPQALERAALPAVEGRCRIGQRRECGSDLQNCGTGVYSGLATAGRSADLHWTLATPNNAFMQA